MKTNPALLMVIIMQMTVYGQNSATTPSDCEEHDLSAYGHPVMIPIGKDVSLGVSLAQQEFKPGNEIEIHIWGNSSGDTPADVWTCQDLEHFKEWGFDIFGQDGHRILRQDELKHRSNCSTDAGKYKMSKLMACLRNFPIVIPAHTCMTRDNNDFVTELTGQYQLPPGEYPYDYRQIGGAAQSICATHRTMSLFTCSQMI